MSNGAVDDDREALDDPHGDIDSRLGARNPDRHDIAHDANITSDNEQFAVVHALNDDVPQHLQNTLRGRTDVEPHITSPAGHVHLGSFKRSRVKMPSGVAASGAARLAGTHTAKSVPRRPAAANGRCCTYFSHTRQERLTESTNLSGYRQMKSCAHVVGLCVRRSGWLLNNTLRAQSHFLTVGGLFAPVSTHLPALLDVRHLFYACFFALLIAVVYRYGRADAGDIFGDASVPIADATNMVLAFAQDRVLMPTAQVARATAGTVVEDLRAAMDAAESVALQDFRSTIGTRFAAGVEWTYDVARGLFGSANNGAPAQTNPEQERSSPDDRGRSESRPAS